MFIILIAAASAICANEATLWIPNTSQKLDIFLNNAKLTDIYTGYPYTKRIDYPYKVYSVVTKDRFGLAFKNPGRDGLYEVRHGNQTLMAYNNTNTAYTVGSFDITTTNNTFVCSGDLPVYWYVYQRGFLSAFYTENNQISKDIIGEFTSMYCESMEPCGTSNIYGENITDFAEITPNPETIELLGCEGATTRWFFLPAFRQIYIRKDGVQIMHLRHRGVKIRNKILAEWEADKVYLKFGSDAPEGIYTMYNHHRLFAKIHYIPRSIEQDAFNITRDGDNLVCGPNTESSSEWLMKNPGLDYYFNPTGKTIKQSRTAEFGEVYCYGHTSCSRSATLLN